MSDLPSRDSLTERPVNVHDLGPVAGAYVRGDLQTRQEFIDSLRDNPVLDMGDDNHWVMVDLGPSDDVIMEGSGTLQEGIQGQSRS